MSKKKLFDDFMLSNATAESLIDDNGGGGEKLVQLNLRVPESFWREFHDFCRFNDVKKVRVITEAVKKYTKEYGR